MGKARRLIGDEGTVDTDSDRYPKAKEGLRRILDEGEFPGDHVERIEVTFLADGSATYRMWVPRALEPEGGYIPPS